DVLTDLALDQGVDALAERDVAIDEVAGELLEPQRPVAGDVHDVTVAPRLQVVADRGQHPRQLDAQLLESRFGAHGLTFDIGTRDAFLHKILMPMPGTCTGS